MSYQVCLNVHILAHTCPNVKAPVTFVSKFMNCVRICASTPYSAPRDLQKQDRVIARFLCYSTKKKNIWTLYKILPNPVISRFSGYLCMVPYSMLVNSMLGSHIGHLKLRYNETFWHWNLKSSYFGLFLAK